MRLYRFARINIRRFPNELVTVVLALLLGIEIIQPLVGVNSDDNITRTGVR